MFCFVENIGSAYCMAIYPYVKDVLDSTESGPLFTKGTDVLPRDVVKFQSRKIWV